MNIFRMPDEGQLTIEDIAAVVSEAIFPFYPGDVKAYTGESVRSFDAYDIEVVVTNVPNHPFAMSLDRNRLIAETPYDVMRSFYETLFLHYRFRPSLPVEDHIQLGEN